jgi:hypothetical protein
LHTGRIFARNTTGHAFKNAISRAANAGMTRKFLLPQRSGASGAKIPATRRRAVAQTRRIPAIAVINARRIAARQ